MPGQRMSHPEQSTSKKVTGLDDFQFRVFEQVKLSSDDFGVMPYSSTVLRADNLRLRKATEKQVFDALRHLVKVELLIVFEHQDEAYVCAPVWQTWQQIRFPRKTSRPKPSPEILARCDEATQELFRQHPGGRHKQSGQIPNNSGQTSELSGNVPDNIPSRDGSKARHSGAVVPASANANADAHADANAGESARGDRAAPLIVSPLAWGNKHSDHVAGFCDWKCFPTDQAQQFAAQLAEHESLTPEQTMEDVRRWALSVRASGVIPTGKMYDFWNGQWEGTHGSSQPVTDGAAGRQARTKQRLSRFVEDG